MSNKDTDINQKQSAAINVKGGISHATNNYLASNIAVIANLTWKELETIYYLSIPSLENYTTTLPDRSDKTTGKEQNKNPLAEQWQFSTASVISGPPPAEQSLPAENLPAAEQSPANNIITHDMPIVQLPAAKNTPADSTKSQKQTIEPISPRSTRTRITTLKMARINKDYVNVLSVSPFAKLKSNAPQNSQPLPQLTSIQSLLVAPPASAPIDLSALAAELISEPVLAPKLIPESKPALIAEHIPPPIPETIPEAIPQVTSELTPQLTPEPIPETTPEPIPPAVPDITPQAKIEVEMESLSAAPAESASIPANDSKTVSSDELRNLIHNHIKHAVEQISDNSANQSISAGKEFEVWINNPARSKFVGPSKPTEAKNTTNSSATFKPRIVPPEIRKACLILGLRPEDISYQTVQESWKKSIALPGVHPDQGGDTELAVYLNTAKDTLMRWLDVQAPKLGKQFGPGKKEPPDAKEKGKNKL